jgi:hypothetical protein
MFIIKAPYLEDGASPNYFGELYILGCNITTWDTTCTDNCPEICKGRENHLFKQSCSTGNLPLAKKFHVVLDHLDESKLTHLLQIADVQTTQVHLKEHVRKKHVLLCKLSPASHFFFVSRQKNKMKNKSVHSCCKETPRANFQTCLSQIKSIRKAGQSYHIRFSHVYCIHCIHCICCMMYATLHLLHAIDEVLDTLHTLHVGTLTISLGPPISFMHLARNNIHNVEQALYNARLALLMLLRGPRHQVHGPPHRIGGNGLQLVLGPGGDHLPQLRPGEGGWGRGCGWG